MHGNMVFSTHYILGTPQQSGGFLVCSVDQALYGVFPGGNPRSYGSIYCSSYETRLVRSVGSLGGVHSTELSNRVMMKLEL